MGFYVLKRYKPRIGHIRIKRKPRIGHIVSRNIGVGNGCKSEGES